MNGFMAEGLENARILKSFVITKPLGIRLLTNVTGIQLIEASLGRPLNQHIWVSTLM